MSAKLKKVDKYFVLTDSSVNVYGFRLLTEGYLIDEYKKNPIGYAMHQRDHGVLVRWEDLKVEGDKVMGKPVINLNHPMGQRTVDEIENGFVNAASVGHIVVLETSEEVSLKLDGQTGPTITKWFNRECSLVDVPGNYNALIKLYDVDDNEINLADFSKNKLTDMKQIVFTPLQIQSLNLKADATEIEIATAFNDLVAKAAKATQLETELNGLRAQVSKDNVEGQLSAALAAKKINETQATQLRADYKENPNGLKSLLASFPSNNGSGESVNDLLDKAVNEKRITVQQKTTLAADYKENPEGLKKLLATFQPYVGLSAVTGGTAGNEKRVQDLMAKSYDDLMDSGESEELMKLAPDMWKQKEKDAGITVD